MWKFGNSILMPLTLCTQKEFLIELNGFWLFFTFGLRNFHRGGEAKWAFFQKPLDNFLWKFGNSILMPLTLCTQKVFLIESNLNGNLDLETFIGEREHFTLQSFVKFCESHPNASVYMYLNGSFGWMKIKCIFGGFCCYSWT